MKKDIVKKGYELAQKELEEKQIEEVKKIVVKTLEKIKEKEKQKREIEKELKILRKDLKDLKEGRLDLIAERQEKDPKARDTSVVIIIKEKEVVKEKPWYIPYQVIWKSETPTYWSTSVDATCYSSGVNSVSTTNLVLTGSVVKSAVPGTYNVGDEVVYL